MAVIPNNTQKGVSTQPPRYAGPTPVGPGRATKNAQIAPPQFKGTPPAARPNVRANPFQQQVQMGVRPKSTPTPPPVKVQ